MKHKNIFVLGALCLAFFPVAAQQGLIGEYFNGTNFENFVTSRVDNGINFDYTDQSPAPGVNTTHYSIRWTGKILAPKSGKYTFYVFADDGIRMWVNGQGLINAWFDNDHGEYSNTIQLQAGQYYDIKIEYYNGIVEGQLTVKWTMPNETVSNAKPVSAQNLYQTAPPKTEPVVVKPVAKKKPPVEKKSEPVPQPPAETPEKIAAIQKELELKPIYFVRSKDIILPASTRILDNWMEFLRKKPEATIIVSGHTEDLGNAGKNQLLSEKRADLVAEYLAKHGLEASRIQTKGYGSTKPYFKNAKTEAERASNRRVEIRVKK